MNVPFIDILRYEPNFLESMGKKTLGLLEKGFFVGGPVVGECEQALANYTRARHVVGCANGTDALQLALRAAGVEKDDTVLLPDMTFWATYEAVVNVGASPVTLDVSRETLHLTLESVREGIDQFNPKAILLVHLYGWAAPETLEIRKLCREKQVLLIEDCAQAIGTSLNDQDLIAGAQIATTSFYPAKVLGASGDAGAVFAQDELVAKRVRQLANHGRTEHYEHGLVGWNSRFGAYEAQFLLEVLPHLDTRLESRREVCLRYRNEITNPALTMLAPAKNVKENGYLSVALMTPQTRVLFIDYLKSKNIGFGTVYPGAMSEQSGAKKHLKGKISHGHAQWIASSIINLPCFAYMTKAEVDYVIDCVNKFNS